MRSPSITHENVPSDIRDAATRSGAEVLAALRSSPSGLTAEEAATRRAATGPNALRPHRARGWAVLARQLRSPILLLLFATAVVSMFLGEAANAVIIGVILIASIGLGFANEYRAARTADALHDRLRHTAAVRRDGDPAAVDVTDLVPGDVVLLHTGSVVPADLRLLDAQRLTCDESIITGESAAVEKDPAPVPGPPALGDLVSCALMGTVVQSGSGTGVVVTTGGSTEFGRIARGLDTHEPQTEFQRGLGRFSVLLLYVALGLTSVIFIVNVLLHRPVIDALLFSLAIAVGITPQLLPAVVSTSLASGSRALLRRRVLVKRLVCIEDLGDLDVLVTDKTGTLTEGHLGYTAALPVDARSSPVQLQFLGLLATEADYSSERDTTAGLNPLDAALWAAPRPPGASPEGVRRIDLIAFDHDRRRTTVLVDLTTGERLVVVKGAPEDVMRMCSVIPAGARAVLDAEYAAGGRVVAVATRNGSGLESLAAAVENGLALRGFLVFLDRPKQDARASLDELARLDVAVKVATGDSADVAEKVLADLGVALTGTLTGAEIDALDDHELHRAAAGASIFARVSPEQKARIISVLRHSGRAVGFLGDGVNDALALHQADIGISVDSASDVAKDAADVLLLDKDLGVLAAGVLEGRRIFSNTIKYVLMGTSSNFGNMFSASAASVVLPFLPMLPGQILLNNLLYDSGQLAIPGDRVDREQLQAPSHWDIGFIRRFMLLFGPISSLFDVATFALMLLIFHAGEAEFQAGWFIESIATQTLIIFAIRTRRVPFFRSRPSLGLLLASLAVVAVGVWLPYSPLSAVLGFRPLPWPFFLALVAMVILYLGCVELAKARFFARQTRRPVSHGLVSTPMHRYERRLHRRSARFTTPAPSRSSL